MTKLEFLTLLQEKLAGLPQTDIAEHLGFYGEMIDDRMEEGLLEEEAVAQIGNVADVAQQIIGETPLKKLVKEKIRPRRNRKTWETVLLIVGSPIWGSLLIAATAVILSLYVSLWAILIALWAVFAALAAGNLGGVASGIIFLSSGHTYTGLFMIGSGLICGGLAIFMFYLCKSATKGTLFLSGKMGLWIKKCFMRKETAK